MHKATKPTYRIVEREGLFYVFGYVGGGKYMQMSDGFKSRKDAALRAGLNAAAERSARAELKAWDGKRGRD